MLELENFRLETKHYNKDGSLNKKYKTVRKFLQKSKEVETWFNDTVQIMWELGYNIDVVYLPDRLKNILHKCFGQYKELTSSISSSIQVYEGDFGVTKLIDHPRIKPKDINFNNCLAFCDEHPDSPTPRGHAGLL